MSITRFHRFVALGLLVAMFASLPRPLLAQLSGEDVVAVVPLIDGDADEVSREAAEAIGQTLQLATGLHVLGAKTVEQVRAYQKDDGNEALPAGAKALSRAKEQMLNFRFREARATIEEALTALRGGSLDDKRGPMLLDAWLTRTLIAKAQNDAEAVRASIAAAVALHPGLTLSAEHYPPSIISVLDAERTRLRSAPAGSLSVKSVPAAAEVLINGIVQGATPLELTTLPAGEYAVMVRANRYLPVERSISIAPGKVSTLDARLKWEAEKKRGNQALDAASQVREGVRLSGILRADAVVLVDARTEKNQTLLSLRTVKASLRAGFKPIEVRHFGGAAMNDQLAEVVAALADQLAADAAADPKRLLDPAGEGDPLVLGKIKKPLYRKPAFWIVVGTVAAGAIAGGILAAMSGHDSQGSVRVQFK